MFAAVFSHYKIVQYHYMRNILLLLCLLGTTQCFNKSEIRHRSTEAAATNTNDTKTAMNQPSFYNLSAKTLDGELLSFEQFRGKKVIVLNVASKCGYTPQYADWEKFYAEHKDNTVVLGFPCNQFMGQEPGTSEAIKDFCQKNYGVSFPIFEKIEVKGAAKSPVYAWLTEKDKNGWNTQEPSWNFCKYLINEKGELMEFFASGIKPDNPEFVKAWGK
jgi:glutathione peroxidase